MNDFQVLFDFRKRQFDDKYSSGLYLFILLFSIGFPFLFFRNGFLDITYLPIFLMGYISLILLSLPIPFFRIRIFQDQIIATNIFGIKKNIPNSEIEYDERYYAREQGVQTLELVIKYKKRNFKIYEDEINNYDSLKSFCKVNYRRFREGSLNYYHFSIALVVVLGVLLQFGSNLNLKMQEFENKKSIEQKGFIKIRGTVKDYKNRGKNGEILYIELYEYSKFDFSPLDFSKNREKYYNILKSQDSITLYIAPNQFEKKN